MLKNLRSLIYLLPMALALSPGLPASANSEASSLQSGSESVNYGPDLYSVSAMVYDQDSGKVLYSKNADQQTPIASITKLMTAVVLMDAKVDMQTHIKITREDLDRLKHTRSRLPIGAVYTREQLLNMALIASENRAAHALGRTTFAGGESEFVAAMNNKARQLGMQHSFYVDPTGLDSSNRSTAEDLVKLVNYAYEHYPEIRRIASTGQYDLGYRRVLLRSHRKRGHRMVRRVAYCKIAFNNTNRLTRDGNWDIGLSKTGFINEAGHCLVMQARIAQRDVIIVLLDSYGKYSRIGDAQRIRNWLENKYAAIPRT